MFNLELHIFYISAMSYHISNYKTVWLSFSLMQVLTYFTQKIVLPRPPFVRREVLGRFMNRILIILKGKVISLVLEFIP
jgi:hypothetical protein